MGAAARAHVEALRTSRGHRARATRRAIDATLALVRDPAHKALAIWGKALADMGVGRGTTWPDGLGLELRAGPRRLRRNAIELAAGRARTRC